VAAPAADALGKLGGASASKLLLAAVDSHDGPWVRNRVVSALGNFKDDTTVAAKLNSVARQDDSYRARAAALQALGRLKGPNALPPPGAPVASDSPDGIHRHAALRSLA